MDLTNWLNYFGITPQQITPLILASAVWSSLAWKYFLRDMKAEVTDLHHATKEIQKYIEDRDDDWTPQHALGANPAFAAYGKTKSPTIPNAEGDMLLKNAKFYEQYPKFKDDLFRVMEKMELRTLYDYEKGAKRALRQLQDDPRFDPIKEYVVGHPEATLALIFTVASWVVREDFAKAYPIQGGK